MPRRNEGQGVNPDIDNAYSVFYKARAARRVYPVEFVVRAFLGSYPRLTGDKARYVGQRVLDLGFGDGRNMPLLADLGFAVCGVDIDARVGRNVSIPFDDRDFDAVLACHACYYIDPGVTFADNVAEIARVLKPGGRFAFSVPMGSSYIMRGADDLGGGHMRIARDPYGLRNGYVLKKFDTEAEIEAALAPFFTDFSLGACRNDWWGIEEHVWIGACMRRSG
jgi:SAM-dependent methyltransferase